MNNLFHNLPNELKIKIWEFDNTYKIKFNTCIRELKNIKNLHKMYKKANYRIIKKNKLHNFSNYYIKWYINKQYSKTLFKYYYGQLDLHLSFRNNSKKYI